MNSISPWQTLPGSLRQPDAFWQQGSHMPAVDSDWHASFFVTPLRWGPEALAHLLDYLTQLPVLGPLLVARWDGPDVSAIGTFDRGGQMKGYRGTRELEKHFEGLMIHCDLTLTAQRLRKRAPTELLTLILLTEENH